MGSVQQGVQKAIEQSQLPADFIPVRFSDGSSFISPATEQTLLSVAGFNIPTYDYIGVAYPDTSTEVFTYKTGGSGGTTVATVTVVYSDPVTKQILSSVTKS